MCVSAATLNAQTARKLEWSQGSDSEEEDESCLQAASFGLKSQESRDSQNEETSTSTSMPSLPQHSQKFYRNNTELGYQLNQLQQVRPCKTKEELRPPELHLSKVCLCRQKRRGVWLNYKRVYSKSVSESYIICMISGKT